MAILATPLSNFGYFNNASAGAPTLSGTAGDMYALLHYAFTTISNWSRIFNTGTPTFAAVWQPAAGGSTPVLTCQDNATTAGDARAATVRLAEAASSSTAYTDPVPTVAQMADNLSVWLKSTVASATTRPYHCVVYDTGIILAVKTSGLVDTWELYFAGKCFQRLSAANDPYPWMILQRGNSSAGTSVICALQSAAGNPSGAGGKCNMLRHPQGTIKSTSGILQGRGTSIGTMAGGPVVGSGYLGTFDMEKVLSIDIASATTSVGGSPLVSRLCIPNLYQGLHPSYTGSTETDTLTVGARNFQILRGSSANTLLLETTNTFTGFPLG